MRQRELEFKVDDWVSLKVYPMKEIMRFGKKRKLNPHYIGPYQIVGRIGNVVYELEFSTSLASIHLVFHKSMLKKCVVEPSLIVPVEDAGVRILCRMRKSRLIYLIYKLIDEDKVLALVKVLWRNKKVEEATLEAKEDMRVKYPFLLLGLDESD